LLNKHNIEFERISAIDGNTLLDIVSAESIGEIPQYWNKNAAGMCLSLVKVLTDAKLKKLDSILILEDDIDFESFDILEHSMNEVPYNWESLFFGLNKRGLNDYSDHWYTIKSGYALHCHAVRHTVYDLLIDKLMVLNNPADKVYDIHLFPRGASYLHFPTLAWQRPSYSSITNQFADYTFLKQ
jgi:hypothetical protein